MWQGWHVKWNVTHISLPLLTPSRLLLVFLTWMPCCVCTYSCACPTRVFWALKSDCTYIFTAVTQKVFHSKKYIWFMLQSARLRTDLWNLWWSMVFHLGFPQAGFTYVDHHRHMTYWPTAVADGKISGFGWQVPNHARMSPVARGNRGKGWSGCRWVD